MAITEGKHTECRASLAVYEMLVHDIKTTWVAIQIRP